jgi:cytochrome b561
MDELLEYSSLSKFFHWLVALIVIVLLSFSFFLDDVPDAYQKTAYMIHKSCGLTVLWLMVLRFLWLQYRGRPSLPLGMPGWEVLLSRFVQYSFYFFLLCMPLCGWIMSVAAGRVPSYFGLFDLPLPIAPNKALSELMWQGHKIIAWILIGLISLHIAGALKHHFINKDNVLRRIV